MAHHQLAHWHERKAQGSFCCCSRAGRRRTTAADKRQGSATSAGGQGLAHRRTPRVRREEILSRQPPRSGRHHQGTMDLRTGPPADERRTRPRPLRGPILARPSPTCAHDNDRLRLPSASSPHPSETGKKESTDRHLSQACPPCVTPSSASSCDHCSDARTVEYGYAARGLKKICQSSARLHDPAKSGSIADPECRCRYGNDRRNWLCYERNDGDGRAEVHRLEPGCAMIQAPDGLQLTVEAVVKEFTTGRGHPPVRALDRIDLQICTGEFVSLLGPSGCGKSTLLNIIAGFQAPTAGRILHQGKPITQADRRRTVVFQDYALFPWMTIQRNIEFGLKAQGIGAQSRAVIARGFIDRVRLSGFEDRYPHEVSGGMKQRAAIARALAPNPDMVLMDEPFGALDAQTRVLLQEEVARLTADTRKTVLFVTHSIEEAVFLADRVVVMSARPGRIRSEIAVSLSRPRIPEMRYDPWFIRTVQELWQALKPEWQEGSGNHDSAH